MTDLDVIERAAVVMKAHGIKTSNISTHHYPSAKPHWKSCHTLAVNGHQFTQALAAMLWPWLGSRRRARVAEILSA